MNLDVVIAKQNDLQNKIAKKNLLIQKKNALIEKNQNWIDTHEKIHSLMKLSESWNADNPPAEEDFQLYFAGKQKFESIESAQKAIKEAETAISNYEKQLNKLAEDEKMLHSINESASIPAFLNFKTRIVHDWDSYLFEKRLKLIAAFQLMDPCDFLQKYDSSGLDIINSSEEEIHQKNVQFANELVYDLILNVYKYIGKITNASDLCLSYGNDMQTIINGVVFGEYGSCTVKSYTAGGWNIQKRHIRTLVKHYEKKDKGGIS